MADKEQLQAPPIQVVTGFDFSKAHPFYQERQKLDNITGHDWLMLISLALACSMGFRLGAIALQLSGFPVGLSAFFALILMGLALTAAKFKSQMPRQLSVIACSCLAGFAVGFFL